MFRQNSTSGLKTSAAQLPRSPPTALFATSTALTAHGSKHTAAASCSRDPISTFMELALRRMPRASWETCATLWASLFQTQLNSLRKVHCHDHACDENR